MESARQILPHIRLIRFDDDTFVFPRSVIEEFVREYPARIGLPFDILMHPDAYNEEILGMLQKVGLCHMQVGIQSASPDELEESFERKGSSQGILALKRSALKLGIATTFDIILDNPLASRADKEATLDLLLRMPRPFNLNMFSLTAYPKSETATKLLEAGFITEDDIEGRATKSFRQYRLTLDYPRPAEETFYASLISLTSKGFVPRGLIHWLGRMSFLRRRPGPVRLLAQAANGIKLAWVALSLIRRGEMSLSRWREYVTRGGWLVQ